jgi:hypothetical protein
MQRLDALPEILGPDWVAALGSDMTQTPSSSWLAGPTPIRSSGWAGPGWPAGSSARPARPGRAASRRGRLGGRGHPGVVGTHGTGLRGLAADIATEASLALELARQIARLDERIFDHYGDADPDHILLSVPGVGKILASQIRGRLGDPAGSPAWPRPDPSPGSSRTSTPQGSPTPPAARPNTATPACARRCSWPPTTPARPTPPRPPATSG